MHWLMKATLMSALVISLTACGKGREATMDVTAIVEGHVLDQETEVTLAHCKKSASVYNYYIEIPSREGETGNLTATYTGNKRYYTITFDGKSEKVTNHGWEFVAFNNN